MLSTAQEAKGTGGAKMYKLEMLEQQVGTEDAGNMATEAGPQRRSSRRMHGSAKLCAQTNSIRLETAQAGQDNYWCRDLNSVVWPQVGWA